MINANELRIGNMVNWCNPLDNKNEIVAINNRDFDLIIEKNMGHLYSPIPLTPEVLEAAGFKNVQGDYWIIVNELMISFDSVWWWTNSWQADGEFGFDVLAPFKEIQYLHQLQNLYWCLSGEELKINL